MSSKNIDNLFEESTNPNSESGDGVSPFFTVAKKSQAEKHKWLLHALNVLTKNNRQDTAVVNDNYRFYTGRVFTDTSLRYTEYDSDYDMETRMKNERLYVNYIKTYVKEQCNRLLEIKPSVEILPVNNEFDDKMGAKAAKVILDTIWYDVNFDKVLREAVTRTKIAGEHYLAVLWDPNIGDLHPEFKKAELEGTKIPAIDEDGNVIPGKFIDQAIRIGDVTYRHIDRRRLLAEQQDSWDKVNYVIEISTEYTDVLKKLYPEKAHKIMDKFDPTLKDCTAFDANTIAKLNKQKKTVVLRFWHSVSQFVKEGAQMVATLDCMLSDDPLEYKHGKLPIVRLTDEDVPGELHADSFIESIKGMQIQYYSLTSSIIANQRLFGYPKWFVQANSVDVNALANIRNVVVYRGAKPEVYKPEPTPTEIFNFRASLPQEMKLIGTGTMSDPLDLIKNRLSGVAMQFYNEQDMKRFNTDIAKVFSFIQDVAKLTLAVIAQKYKISDGRLGRMVGKNNEHMLTQFDRISLDKPYDVRVAMSTGLPDSKAARVQTILDLGAQFETLFTREQILDALELGDSNKLFDQSTVAVKTAESIVEDLTQGNPVAPPDKYMNLIILWKVLLTRAQQRDFSELLPEQTRNIYLDYWRAVELLMVEKAQVNPKFQEETLQLSLFPAVFELAPPPPIPMLPEDFSGEEGVPGSEPILSAEDTTAFNESDPAAQILTNRRDDAGSL